MTQFETYCQKWKLTVNVDKTKVVIFQKGGRFPNDNFTFNGKELEIVKEFNYLGYVVSSGGTLEKALHLLADKAVRAMGLLFSTIRHVQVPFKMLLQLFDTYVKSTLNYSCEIWDFLLQEGVNEFTENFLKEF